jgi:hypothetical protein
VAIPEGGFGKVKAELHELVPGDEVWWCHGAFRDNLEVTRVGRKYVYIKPWGRETGFYKQNGRENTSYSPSYIKTDLMLARDRRETVVNAAIKSAQLDRLSYSWNTGWSLDEKEQLVEMLRKLGKLP